MEQATVEALGLELFEALTARRTVAPLTSRGFPITIDDAYAIQKAFLGHRIGPANAVVGKKIGVTSRPVQSMLGVTQPDFGLLLADMAVPERGDIPMSTMIQPRAEGEIGFVLKRDLIGPGITNADVLRATEGVIACLEIVDSRITDWKIAIQDTVADNASCGVFVLGDRLVDPATLDLALAGMVIEKNGRIVGTGAGAATLDSPVNAVAWLANTLGARGIPLKAGEVILSGSLAALIPVTAGDAICVTIQGIGCCHANFVA
ncbi:fumarylacetoacetate hydrolase family protein [Zavarzinia sp.]|uniref:fumarylacetoacetate hydrolase family protein n=1 Tax=Zavarzinia sp. TaxID=2027920 RepID=UPI00356646B4